VRIGSEKNEERYLVPLGFVSHRGTLYAMTTHGRKTRMAAVNPSVSFQIDTSARTGLFSWHSISGEGTFEIVADSKEIEAISPLLVSRFPDMPNWMQDGVCGEARAGRSCFHPYSSVQDDGEKERACVTRPIEKPPPNNAMQRTRASTAISRGRRRARAADRGDVRRFYSRFVLRPNEFSRG